MNPFWMPAAQALTGGLLIGLASWLLLAGLGRIAGISGIAASTLVPDPGAVPAEDRWRMLFLAGLVIGGALAYFLISAPTSAPKALPLLLTAGSLVGVGTVLGSGCTSGHGVCGLGRRSARSLVATLTFMAAGIVTVAIMQKLA